MTNKIITFTDRFKAASSAPIDLFWDHSPLTFVSQVKTPTLFLVGEQDPRVPMRQSIEMYRALRTNVPAHFYVAREPITTSNPNH